MGLLQGSRHGWKGVVCGLGLAFLSAATPLRAENSPINVSVKPFSEIATYPQHRAPAVVVPENDSKINAQVTAIIREIPVRVGQVVNKGVVLVRLQSADFSLILQSEEAALKSLQSKIELARYQLQRAQALSKQKAVADELLKQRETDLAVLLSEQTGQQAVVEQARRNLEKCTVVAPYAAIISEKFAQVGELASPGTPLLRIIDREHSEVSAKLPTAKVDLARSVRKFKFVTENNSYDLIMRAITPSVDTVERTQEVRLEFTADAALPGTAGELQWEDTEAYLPAEYLLRRKNMLGVFIVTDKRAQFVALPTAVEGRPARVSFRGDQKVVDKGRYRLQHGDTVIVK